jgi:uncharacterized DUF497 family protein
MGETDDLEWEDSKDAVNRQKHGFPLAFSAFSLRRASAIGATFAQERGERTA